MTATRSTDGSGTPRTLPVTAQAPEEGACCGACAERESARHTDSEPPPPVRPKHPHGVSREADRRITFGGLIVAAAMLGLAGASLALPSSERHGVWLPLHLALAGAAGTAIAAVLPFFSAAIAVARPMPPTLRVGGVGLIAVAAVAVSVGVVRGSSVVAVAGGLAYVTGLALVAVAAFAPLPGSLAPRRRIIGAAYAVAIVEVAVGVVLATAMLAGFGPVVDRWALLKPAHAWLNVFGFVSVVIATSLVHLAPTVAGSRIRPRRSAVVAMAALVVGAPVVALGFALGSDLVARMGASFELAGGLALAVHGLVVQRDRGTWATDPRWHLMAGWSIAAAPIWFVVAVAIASGRILQLGATPAAWSIELLAPPLVLGWLVQVLIGSWTHLVPAIGPGDLARHAAQRAVLGRWATARLLLLNTGIVLVVAGQISGAPGLTAAGAAGCLTAIAASLAMLIVAALATGRREPQAIRVAPSGGG